MESETLTSGSPVSSKPQLPQHLKVQWMLLPAALGLLGVFYHEWWRDEAYTWLVVGASGTVGELVRNLGFNGHPRAYYILAWLLHRMWNGPLALSLANLALSLAAIFLFLRAAPVTRFQSALFSLGFYPLYQYGIISRSYSLLMFLLFLYCYLRSTRPTAVAARLIVLAALAQVHLIAMLAAGALLVFDAITSSAVIRYHSRNWAAAAVVVVSLATSAWQMTPGKTSAPGFGAVDSSEVLLGFSNAFVPNFGLLNEASRVQHFLQRELGFILFLGSLILLWPRRKALLAYAMLAGSLLTICIFVYSGYRWHHGMYFIFMLVALWLTGGPMPVGMRGHFLSIVLGVQTLVGFYALGSDLVRPYSDGRLVAHYMYEQKLDDLPLVGLSVIQSTKGASYQWEVDGIQPVLVELNGTKIYDPKSGSFESFFTHYAFRDYFPMMNRADAEREIHTVASRLGVPFVVVVMRHTAPDVPLEMPESLQKLKDFPQPLDFGEAYSLFLYSR